MRDVSLLVLLEELPLEVVRVPERDHGQRTVSIEFDSVGHRADRTQRDLEPIKCPASAADPNCEVIEADTPLAEVFASRCSWQGCTQHQPRSATTDPETELAQVGEVLIQIELRKSGVERSRTVQTCYSQSDVVETAQHATTLRNRLERAASRR